MKPVKFLAILCMVVLFSAGGFGLMHWVQSGPAVARVAQNQPAPIVVNRLSGCQGFNQSIDEAIALQDRIGHSHNSVRLAALKRDCAADDQEHYRTSTR